eukprot:UN17581
MWCIGFVFLIIFPLPLDLYAMANTPQSLPAPLSSFTLLFNALFAHFFQDETMVWLDAVSTGLICLGSSLSTATGEHIEPVYNT